MLDAKVTALDLKDASLLETRAYINGAWVEGDATFPVHNPATGDLIANVADITIEGTSQTIDAAYAAKKDWAAQDRQGTRGDPAQVVST